MQLGVYKLILYNSQGIQERMRNQDRENVSHQKTNHKKEEISRLAILQKGKSVSNVIQGIPEKQNTWPKCQLEMQIKNCKASRRLNFELKQRRHGQ